MTRQRNSPAAPPGNIRQRDLDRRTAEADRRYVVAQQRTIIVTVVGSLLVFWRGTADAFSTPKITVVLLGVIVLLGLGLSRAVQSGRVLLARTPAAPLAVAFVTVASITSVAGGLGMVSFLGSYGRNVGVVPYATYVALFLVVLRVGSVRWLEHAAWWLTIGLAAVCAYGLLQAIGGDPFTWTDTAARQSFSTLGQENFAAGAGAILLPLSLGTAALSNWRGTRGRVGLLVAAATLILVWRTNSFQGPVASLAAVLPLGAVLGLDRWRSREQTSDGSSRRVRTAVTAAGAAVVVLGAVVMSRAGSELVSGTRERRYLWRAAMTMIGHHPAFGNGFGYYGLAFTRLRPAAHALAYGLLPADAPHDVVLEHAVSGGILVVGIYLTFVLYTGWTLAVGLRCLQGRERLLLATFGGGWLAYQVQSLVSIDVPPVAILHWFLAGAVIYLARRPSLRTFTFASSLPDRVRLRVAVQTIVVVVALGAGWFTVRPLQADVSSAHGRDIHAHDGDPMAEVRAYDYAVRLAPWQPHYGAQLASAYAFTDRTLQSLQAGERAARLDPGNTVLTLATAQTAEYLGDVRLARYWFDTAIRNDPHAAAPQNALGKYFVRRGQPERALGPLKLAARRAPANAKYWMDEADALKRTGSFEEALSALEHFLRRNPETPAVRDAIAQMKAASG